MAKRKRPVRNVSERIAFARLQRQQSNEFSKDVWEMVRGRRVLGEKFRREYPCGPYTLDFVCLEWKLVIEIDGKDHLTAAGMQHDKERDGYLRDVGFEVLRFHGFRVTQDREGVRREIEQAIRRRREEEC